MPVAVRGALRRIVERAVDVARKEGDIDSGTSIDVHMLGSSSDSDSDSKVACELHGVSLTRPFFLRGYQREEMNRAVRDIAKSHPPYVNEGVGRGGGDVEHVPGLGADGNERRAREGEEGGGPFHLPSSRLWVLLLHTAHSRHFRISRTMNTRGLFSVWRSVRVTKRYSHGHLLAPVIPREPNSQSTTRSPRPTHSTTHPRPPSCPPYLTRS